MGDMVHVEPYWYCEHDRLGTGTFGEVYRGFHESKRWEKLAIKRMKKGKLPQNIVDREILILQELSAPDVQHAHFVSLVDCIQTASHVYLVMEFCNGGDLDHYLAVKKKLDEYTINIFLRQIASAMKVLHDKDIVHRDLKPANILLSHNGPRPDPPVTEITFKIGDFGLGRFLDSGQAETFCGTPVYMAPEIFKQHATYDYKADLYSIGAIIYQCHTATLFDTFGAGKMNLPPNTSAPLKDLITKLLQREPSKRANFSEFVGHPFIGSPQNDKPASNDKKPALNDKKPMSNDKQPIAIPIQIIQAPKKKEDSPAPQEENGQPPQPAATGFKRFGIFRRTSRKKSVKAPETSPTEKEAQRPHSPMLSPNNNGDGESDVLSPKSKEVAHRRNWWDGFFFRQLTIQESSISSELVKSIEVKDHDVYGITFLGNLIYVLCRATPNLLVVYSSQGSYYRGTDVRLNEIKFPQDISASLKSNCLYITDIGHCCIWKVTVIPSRITRWATGVGAPHTLSVSNEGHVITFGIRIQTLLVFGVDGTQIQSINLPSGVQEPQHVVQNSAGNYIVSYGEVGAKKPGKQGVCEVSAQGKLVRQYDSKKPGQGKLLHPYHMAIDSEGRAIVADNGNDRLIVLNAELKLEQFLPSDDADKVIRPFRLCLLPPVGVATRLMVEHRRNTIDIYNLTTAS